MYNIDFTTEARIGLAKLVLRSYGHYNDFDDKYVKRTVKKISLVQMNHIKKSLCNLQHSCKGEL